jgi:hypothetical protein
LRKHFIYIYIYIYIIKLLFFSLKKDDSHPIFSDNRNYLEDILSETRHTKTSTTWIPLIRELQNRLSGIE